MTKKTQNVLKDIVTLDVNTHKIKALVAGGRKYSFLALLTITICVLAIYIHQHRQGRTTRMDNVLVLMTGVVQQNFFYLGRGSRALADHYILLVNAKKQNDELMKQLDVVKNRLALLQDIQLENRRLREALEFEEKLEQPVLLAHVVAHDASSDYFGLRIDKGSVDGVKEGLGVVSPAGVVGRILQVTKHYSIVQTLIDPASNIDVVIQRSRSRGILSGQSKQLQCKIKYLDRLEDVMVNDVVVSTDFGSIFPNGLVVGYVNVVIPTTTGILQTVLVKSAVDIFRLEEVSIVFPRLEPEKNSDQS